MVFINLIGWWTPGETVAITARRKSDGYYLKPDGTWQAGAITVPTTEDDTNLGSAIQSAYYSGVVPDAPYVWVMKTSGGDIIAGDPSYDIMTDLETTIVNISATVASLVTSVGALENLSPSDVQTIIETNKLDHLVAVADADDVADDSVIAKLAAKLGDWSDFDKASDSLQAIRDRGDLSWVSGVGAVADGSHTTTSWTRTVGDDDGGTVNDVEEVDGTTLDTGETSSGAYLQVDGVFTIDPGEVPVSVDVWGHYNGGSSHYIIVQALDLLTSQYEPIGTMPQQTEVGHHQFPLSPGHVDGSDQVSIRFLHAGGNGNPAHVFVLDKVQVNAAQPSSELVTSVIDGVWDELLSGHTDAGSAGEALGDTVALIGDEADDGDDTLFGWLKAMASKAASTPAGVGGTYDPATDSLEGIKDTGVVGSGTTTRSVTHGSDKQVTGAD